MIICLNHAMMFFLGTNGVHILQIECCINMCRHSRVDNLVDNLSWFSQSLEVYIWKCCIHIYGWMGKLTCFNCICDVDHLSHWQGSLWLYDCCQRNKQNLNISSEKIKILAGGVFVTSVGIIAYTIPPSHTAAHVYLPEEAEKMTENSKLKNMINRFCGKKELPFMKIDMHSRPVRALFGSALGALCLLGVEDMYLTLSLAGSKRESAKY